MSDTVILAIITAVSGIFVAGIGAYDRRTLAAAQTARTADVAAELVRHNAS